MGNVVLALGVGGSVGVLGAALALGFRHGIDWDHIAAITDITSTTAATQNPDEAWLTREPAVMLTNESHHSLATPTEGAAVAEAERTIAAPEPVAAGVRAGSSAGGSAEVTLPRRRNGQGVWALQSFLVEQQRALFLGTLYAVGHGTVVTALGLLAILASGFLPAWIDPIMERVVGVTLIFLSVYLFYSVYRFFGAAGEFPFLSGWCLTSPVIGTALGGLRPGPPAGHRPGHARPPSQSGAKPP